MFIYKTKWTIDYKHVAYNCAENALLYGSASHKNLRWFKFMN